VILVDTSIWIDHLRRSNEELSGLLDRREVLSHPFVIGELALGHIRNRDQVVALLLRLPHATAARDNEVLTYIEANELAGTGIGYVDAHLLASVLLTPGSLLWTRDKRLHTIALGLSIASISL
jgi:predicted nucleic acid-binding protein